MADVAVEIQTKVLAILSDGEDGLRLDDDRAVQLREYQPESFKGARLPVVVVELPVEVSAEWFDSERRRVVYEALVYVIDAFKPSPAGTEEGKARVGELMRNVRRVLDETPQLRLAGRGVLSNFWELNVRPGEFEMEGNNLIARIGSLSVPVLVHAVEEE